MSLSAHLTASTAGHGRLRFHPDCPRCAAERLGGSLAGGTLVSRRAQAALAAGVLAFSTAAPAAVAQVGEVDQGQEGRAAPEGDQGGLGPDFDPGGDDSFETDTAPIPGGPEAGGQEDDGEGAPVETEPTTDPQARLKLEQSPAVPPPTPEANPTPTPTSPPSVPAPPAAAPPVAAPAPEAPSPDPTAEIGQPAPRKTSTKLKARAPAANRRAPEPRLLTRSDTAPAPVSPAPAAKVEVSSPTPPATTVPVSQPAEAAGPVTGPSYTVREGDSLWSIARRLLAPDASAGQVARQVNRLWQLNARRIATGNPSLIHVGTVLRLP